MFRAKRLIFLLIFIIPLGCTMPGMMASAPPIPTAVSPTQVVPVALVTVPPGATPTPTPFQPIENRPVAGISDSPTPTGGPPWGNYPGPTIPPSIDIPPPLGIFPQPQGQVNVLLLGSDQRPDSGGFRTDTVLLLTVNPAAGSANLTSFPRDLYLYIPGWTSQRINTAHAHGGFPLSQMTFEYNFGVRPDRFIMINFWGFTRLVDSLGGIYVDVAKPLSDQRDRYGIYRVPAGTIFMDGATALWYVRSRYSTSDFDRTRRQQEVLLALFYRLLSVEAVTRAPELYEAYKDAVSTDLRLEDITPFLPLAAQLGDTNNIQRFYIARENVDPWRTPGGAAVLLPRRADVIEIMRQALNVPEN